MSKRLKYIFFQCFLSLLFTSQGYSQFLLYSEQPVDVNVEFLRHTVISSAKQSFFNVVKVVNNSNRTEILSLNLTVPDGWNVLGQDKQEIVINPFDSVYIPIRVAIGGKVQGDIGYSIVASLSDSRGNTVKNEYSFVKIPRETELNVRLIDRVAYFDQRTNMSSFSIKIENKGNKEELVNLNFISDNSIGIETPNHNQFVQDITIPAYSDSTITYNVSLKEESVAGKSMYRLNMTASTIDTTHIGSVWFRVLDPTYDNYISETLKPLVVEFNAQGLMQGNVIPNYVTNITGLLLFPKRKDLYYHYRNYSSKSAEQFYKFNRMYIGTHLGNWQFEFGDSYRTLESPLSGRGGYISYTDKKFKTEIIANQNVRSYDNNFGATLNYFLTNAFDVKTGFAYNQNKENGFDSKLGLIGTHFIVAKNHRFYTMASYNKIKQQVVDEKSHNEFGGELLYSSSFGKFQNTVRAKYGSQLYYGNYRGRFDLSFVSDYKISDKQRFSFYGFESRYNPPKINNDFATALRSSTNRDSKLIYFNTVTPVILLSGGPGYEEYIASNLSQDSSTSFLSTRGFNFSLSGRFKGSGVNSSLTPQIQYGFVNVYNFPSSAFLEYPQTVNRNRFNYQYLSLNYRTRYWGFLTSYTSGPKSIYEQYSYFYFGRQNRRLRLMPYADVFVYKNQIQLILNVSYSNDLIARSTYTNITGQIYWYLPKDWRLGLLTAYSLQNRIDAQEISQTYQTLYVEAGIKKEFNFSHPRIKFQYLTLVFFKDYNGNSTQEPNEPGIKNVLVSINRELDPSKGFIPGDVASVELLSDNYGFVRLENMPAGHYTILYNPVGKEAGTFSKGFDDLSINLDKNTTLYIPFVEKNKVFGKIILNRSKLSGLGRLDVSNVRITATDSQGRSHTTLTNKNGEFIIFAPVTDEYILSINNIFYENFDLRQNNFVVQFNGYKQFEVNFVFDEKMRRINFAATPEGEVVTGVQQVRRTTISGSVKDANSQKPLRAKVNLVNTRTNTVVTSAFSSATTGEYSLSFMAADNYLLEVVADDYWYLSENLVLNQVTTFMSLSRDVLLKPIAVGSKVELNIRFDINSDFLAPESVAELNRLIRLIKQNVSVKLEIQGHCDDLEGLQKPEVALNRAKAVAKYLIENGFSNVEVKSLGNTVPVASNDTEEGRSSNRRVEVEVISK